MIEIAGVPVGGDNPCRVIAEISNNHNGSLALAKRLIRECKDAGADFVKFQCYTPDELVKLRGGGPAPEPWGSYGWSMRDLYQKAQTPHNWFPELVGECQRIGMPWFSSAFGDDSLRLLSRLGCPAYKFAALDVDTDWVLKAADEVRSWGDVVLASSRWRRIPWADLTLYCPPGYPQDWTLLHGGRGGPLDGISYHGTCVDVAGDAIRNALAMLEVHVQLDDIPSELEANVSLTVSQLERLCDAA